MTDRDKGEMIARDHTPRQRQLIDDFSKRETTPQEDEAFGEAFDKISNEIGSKPDNKMSAKLANEITPAAKRAAIENNRPLIKAALQEFRRKPFTHDDNIEEFIKKLSGKVSARTYKGRKIRGTFVKGKTGFRSTRAIRHVLIKTFGISGTRGRKRR